jgi:hypothetical protein
MSCNYKNFYKSFGMNHMTHVVLKEDGKLWYSESLIQESMERAYSAGLMNGLRLELTASLVRDEEELKAIADKLFEMVSEKFNKDFVEGLVWRKAPKYGDKTLFNI